MRWLPLVLLGCAPSVEPPDTADTSVEDSEVDSDTDADSDSDSDSDSDTDVLPERLKTRRWKLTFEDDFNGPTTANDPCYDAAQTPPQCMDRYWSRVDCDPAIHAQLADLNKCVWAAYDIYNWMDWGKPLGTGINKLDSTMVRVENGSLWLDAEPVPGTGPWDCGNELPDYYTSENCPIRSGAVLSRPQSPTLGFDQTYGRFEVTAVIPNAMGSWPAHWLLPTDGGWPEAGEIDIMEAVAHDPTDVHGSFHGGTWDGSTKVHHSVGNHHDVGDQRFGNTAHTYAVEWNSDEIRYFVDDMQIGVITQGLMLQGDILQSPNPDLVGTFTDPFPVDIPDIPFFFILNTSIVPTGGFSVDAFQPVQHRIDRVRAWQPCDDDDDPACVVVGTGSANLTRIPWMSAPKWSPQYRSRHVGDLDGDGDDDLLLRTRSTGHATYLLLADGRGGFAAEQAITASFGMTEAAWSDAFREAVLLDLDGDGAQDVLLRSRVSTDSLLLRSPFGAVETVTTAWGMSAAKWAAGTPVVLDVDGDGDDDLLLVGLETWLLRADGAGGFTSSDVTVTAGMNASRWSVATHEIVVFDVDGDGDDDVLARGRGTAETSWFLRSDGAGGFAAAVDANTVHSGTFWAADRRIVHVGDYDGDGAEDLLFQPRTALQDAQLLRGNPQGLFHSPVTLTTRAGMSQPDWQAATHTLLVGDFTGDGATDLLFQPTEPGRAWVVRADGQGGFVTRVDVTDRQVMSRALWSGEARDAAIADFDGDGRADVLLQGRDAATDTFVLYLAEGL